MRRLWVPGRILIRIDKECFKGKKLEIYLLGCKNGRPESTKSMGQVFHSSWIRDEDQVILTHMKGRKGYQRFNMANPGEE